ncbi:MAG: ribose-phosphate diphosphokinase [Xanthomonadales bacterium]|nr:ribose-phosphate diphosphokinase [Xanthomonadales bacterium]
MIFSLEAPAHLWTTTLQGLGGIEQGSLQYRRFPDGESYIRVHSPCTGRDCVIVASMQDPDPRIPALLFAARTLRSMGARRVGLAAPYLAYMRQDKIFEAGESATARYFAEWLSSHFDWLVTIDPHLHRIHDLAEIYSIPTRVVRSAGRFAEWIKAHVEQPLLIGPDQESEQWAGDVAGRLRAPHLILTKVRSGDRNVAISVPELGEYRDYTPVLVDDIVSTGRTMAETVQQLVAAGLKAPVCLGVHGVLASGALDDLKSAGAHRLVTSNTVENPAAEVDLGSEFAGGIASFLD